MNLNGTVHVVLKDHAYYELSHNSEASSGNSLSHSSITSSDNSLHSVDCDSSHNCIANQENCVPSVEGKNTDCHNDSGSVGCHSDEKFRKTDDNNNKAIVDNGIKSILKNSNAKASNSKVVNFNSYASVREFNEQSRPATKFRADHNYKTLLKPLHQFWTSAVLSSPKKTKSTVSSDLSGPKKAKSNASTDILDQITLKDGLSNTAAKLVTLDCFQQNCSSVLATPFAGSSTAHQMQVTTKKPRRYGQKRCVEENNALQILKASFSNHLVESDAEETHVLPTVLSEFTNANEESSGKPAVKRKLDSQEVPFETALARVAREAYECVVNGNHDEAKAKIVEAEVNMKSLAKGHSESFSKVRCPCWTPRLNSDDITRIKELFPPDNYEVPADDIRYLQCIRGYSFAQHMPDVNTVRCISNHGVHLDGRPFGPGCAYMTSGDYYSSEKVNYLPVPSIWTPQHALMDTAPCISSPGIYINANTRAESSEDSDVTDSEEENAIY